MTETSKEPTVAKSAKVSLLFHKSFKKRVDHVLVDLEMTWTDAAIEAFELWMTHKKTQKAA